MRWWREGRREGGGIRRLESIDSLEEERKERVTDIYTKEAIKAWPKESFAIFSYLLFSYLCGNTYVVCPSITSPPHRPHASNNTTVLLPTYNKRCSLFFPIGTTNIQLPHHEYLILELVFSVLTI